jgi:hypothetical protein
VQNYPVRASHRKNLEPAALAEIARTNFESVDTNGTTVTASWGALRRLTARAEKRELSIEVEMDPKVPVDVAAETVARYNRFLQAVTGYSAKERAKRLRKSVRTDSAED